MTIAPPALAGVIGQPISHSLSPVVHSYWLRERGISGHYIPVELSPTNFSAGIAGLQILGFKGVNVTIPHKEAALALADEISTAARAIGAANTLTFDTVKGVVADCTDGYGFITNLGQSAPEWQASDGPAVVLGAGGAARAILYALIEHGAPEIRLCNRSRDRADNLAAYFGPPVTAVDWSEKDEALDGAQLLVNATALGLSGNEDLTIALDALPSDALVTDIVYSPLETGLLRQASGRGLATVDGLGMLLHQAVPGFERWFGQKPDVNAALRQAVLKR